MINLTVSPAILNANSLEKVVEIVNAANKGKAVEYFGGAELSSGDILAGHYAYHCAEESDSGVSEDEIEAHLDILKEAGAEFDYNEAREEALRF